MNIATYRTYVLDAIERRDVESLVLIWYQTAWMGDEKEEIRAQITDALPKIASWHDTYIPFANPYLVKKDHPFNKSITRYEETLVRQLDADRVTYTLFGRTQQTHKSSVLFVMKPDEEYPAYILLGKYYTPEGNTFRDFVKFYDENKLIRNYDFGEPNKLLPDFVAACNRIAVNYTLAKGASNLTDVLIENLKEGNLEIISFLWTFSDVKGLVEKAEFKFFAKKYGSDSVVRHISKLLATLPEEELQEIERKVQLMEDKEELSKFITRQESRPRRGRGQGRGAL